MTEASQGTGESIDEWSHSTAVHGNRPLIPRPMNRSARRAAGKVCKSSGHLVKSGTTFCVRCSATDL